jgi:hypothetical protein
MAVRPLLCGLRRDCGKELLNLVDQTGLRQLSLQLEIFGNLQRLTKMRNGIVADYRQF